MSHGLRIWNADGSVKLQITDHLTKRIAVYSAYVAAYQSWSITLPATDTSNIVVMGLYYSDSSANVFTARVVINGTTATVKRDTYAGWLKMIVIGY